MTKKNFFKIVLPLLGVLCFFARPFTVQSAAVIEEQPGLKTVVDDECTDPDHCVGWHYCSLTIKKDKGTDTNVEFVAFNTFQNLPLFKVYRESLPGKPYNRYSVNFNCDGNACGFNTDDVQWYGGDRTQDFFGSCSYEDPFCCCRLNNGRLDGCSRSVDYGNNPKPEAKCDSFGADYRPFTEKAFPQYANAIQKGGGCRVFQDTVNRAEDAKAAAKQATQAPTQSSINLKQEASTLNQTKFHDATEVIGQLIKILLSFIGSIALALYIWAGLLWMTAAGSSERIEKARSILVWTTFGVAIMLASYFIVDFVFTTLNV
jgi:hypothetical protein